MSSATQDESTVNRSVVLNPFPHNMIPQNDLSGRYSPELLYTDWVPWRRSRARFTRPFPKHAGATSRLRTDKNPAARSFVRGRNWLVGKLIATAPIFLATLFFAATGEAATPPFTGADAFIQKNCAACHTSSAPAARLDLTKFSY